MAVNVVTDDWHRLIRYEGKLFSNKLGIKHIFFPFFIVKQILLSFICYKRV